TIGSMFESMKALAERSAMERAVLFVNHVVAAEPAALERLRPHAGRSLMLEFIGWPSLLPPLGPFAFRITPAGLVEWLEAGVETAVDLRIAVDVPNPALTVLHLLSGERPAVSVAGDAAFASDLNWLIDNLRWDAQEDLARFVGDAPARELSRLATTIAAAFGEAVRGIRGFVARRNDPASQPAGR
ncbi:MAG: hypothetical protein M3Z16_05775, partial [Pseudomonadota bacterium]|nr:hypothetical protein [Pseudomonadota bacterium]